MLRRKRKAQLVEDSSDGRYVHYRLEPMLEMREGEWFKVDLEDMTMTRVGRTEVPSGVEVPCVMEPADISWVKGPA